MNLMTCTELFSKNLRVLLALKEMKGVDLADELLLKSSTVYAWTHGECIPQAATIDKIADYFDVPVKALFSEKIEV